MSDPRSKTLTQLEQEDWGAASADASHLIATIHTVRDRPLSQLTVEDLRILIGQQVGLEFVIPLALEILREEPLAEGDFYPGDLLMSVLRVNSSYWSRRQDEHQVSHGPQCTRTYSERSANIGSTSAARRAGM